MILERAHRTKYKMILPSLLVCLQQGVAGLSFTARVERAHSYRARSASKKDGLVAPCPFLPSSLVSPQGGGLDLSLTARIERPQLYRGGSASTRDRPDHPSLPSKLARFLFSDGD